MNGVGVFEGEWVGIGLVKMEGIGGDLGEIYVCWYQDEENYEVDEYFVESFCYVWR